MQHVSIYNDTEHGCYDTASGRRAHATSVLAPNYIYTDVTIPQAVGGRMQLIIMTTKGGN